jgi:hypothetical protein
MFVAMGTNKVIFDAALTTPWLVAAAVAAGRLRLTGGRKITATLFATGALLASLLFFSKTQSTRSGNPAIYGYFRSADVFADYSHPVFNLVPATWETTVLGLSIYLASGYYALSLSLGEPFIPTFGVGNSVFLVRQAARILEDPSIESRPYPMRIEKYGWLVGRYWHTIYPWLASDVTFPGVILVVFLIGRYFAQSWVDVITIGEPFAVCMLAQFLIMLFYFAANNQCLQSGEGAVSFVATIVAWRVSRRSGRKMWKSKTPVAGEIFPLGVRSASHQT